ncbi:MAG: hypothetical protein HYT08_03865 [Candidatus Levybacteria bacterium]|nr:hypothetical protein [Candidatus Levybacteria bacterium]
MVKNMIDNQKLIGIFILILIGFFYWFQIRPTLARQNCQQLARERAGQYFNYSFLQDETDLRKSQLQAIYMDQTYERCLHDKGIAE